MNVIAPEVRETIMANHLNRIAGKAAPNRYESLMLKRDGTISPIELTGVLISWNDSPATLNIVSDITERKASEEAVRFMALHDNLTQLPNRYLLMERLEQALAQTRRSKEPLAVLFMDLNGFKQVNDTHGHDVGDMLLKGIASRLQALMRDSDTLARMGGDEFVILLPRVDDRAGVETLIARINETLQSPFLFDSLEIHSHVSVGFSLFPENGDTAEELLRVADQQMYRAKKRSKNIL
ncbi:MAG: sensor domain-containing diguanylate cyclase [Desulfuromonadaceae bacterium]|nr:sensor domain-containing diguanylate cyclase [Desulfuromonas sp.]MDY0185126.1 sensor domain-containing diguanylate cyclase [Desulfuromonadaceae bacterium]